MRFSLHILSAALLASLCACNHEAFVDHLDVSPQTATIPWTGGDAAFSSKGPLDFLEVTAFRWRNGQAFPIIPDNPNFGFGMDQSQNSLSFANELCNISLNLTPSGELLISASHNFYPDTVYFNLTFDAMFESTRRAARILPCPGFDHGEISYNLSTWSEEEFTKISQASKSLINPGDIPVEFTVVSKDQIVAHCSAVFAPFNPEFSNNIFGRNPSFLLPVAGLKPDATTPSLLPYSITYSSIPQDIPNLFLISNAQFNATAPPHSRIFAQVAVRQTKYSFDYALPAINPTSGETITVRGHFIIVMPTSFSVNTEIFDL